MNKNAEEGTEVTERVETMAGTLLTINGEERITVQMAVAAAAASMGAVGKNAKMGTGNFAYNYRSLDDLVNAAHEALTKHGVTFAPHRIEIHDRSERTTKSGSVQFHIVALVTYRIYGPEGDHIEATVLSEAADTGDKAGNKLMSAAYKYAIGQVLSVPFAGMEDQDASVPEPVQQMSAAELHHRLQYAADKLNKTMVEITERWRKDNGDITLDEFLQLPPDRIMGFVRNVVAHAQKVAK